MDQVALQKALEACLVTDAELSRAALDPKFWSDPFHDFIDMPQALAV